MKKLVLMMVMLIAGVSLSACGKKSGEIGEGDLPTNEPIITEEPVSTEEPAPTEDPHIGEALSKLTGEYVPEKVAKRRPYAIMINNIEYASRFHSGISQASILYEAKVEGGITRLMGIFEEFDSKKIGSVRSARHYYVSVASEYDAIFVHFGHTKFVTTKLNLLNVDNLSGLSGIGSTVFYRDNSISAPHNAFASTEGLLAGRKSLDYRKNYNKDYEGHYKFNEVDTDLENGEKAKKVTVSFSSYASPYFIYDKSNKVYKRYQYGVEHIDTENKEQLTFKNLIIQYVDDQPIVPGHAKDYRTINFEDAKGKGVYITNGKAVNITWEKHETKGIMKYYSEDGTELIINPGKTYVALLPQENSKLTIAKKVE